VTRGGNFDSASDGSSAAEAIVGQALEWLLRGGTWEGLARELAWEAVRSTGIELSCLAWLPELVEAQLSEHVDGLEFVLEDAGISAQADHLHQWPQDHVGAGAAATSAMQERAMEQVSYIYLKTLQWAVDLLTDRITRSPRSSVRPRLRGLRRDRPTEDLEVPAVVAKGLRQDWPRYGWPRPAEAQRPEAA
jgi:hypothetical protein